MHISSRSYCFLLLWFGFIALCAQLMPYFANDYRYVYIQGTHDLIGSFSDILLSQYHHYFEWGGRSVAHAIAQFLLWIGKPHSSVIQALVYVALILFIYYNAYGVRPTLRLRFRPLVVISLLLFLQLRAYGEVVFNIVSSANFLYTTLIILMFLLPYRIGIERKLTLHPVLLYPLMTVLGLLSGWSVENAAAAVAVMLGLYLLIALYRGVFSFWQLWGYLCFLVGFALLVFAPGNGVRYQYLVEHNHFDYIEHVGRALGIACDSLLLSGLLLAILVYLLIRIHHTYLQTVNPTMWRAALFFLGLSGLSLGLMIFAPNFPARACTPATVFLIVALMSLGELVVARYHQVLPEPAQKGLFAGASVLVLALICNMVIGLVFLHSERSGRDAKMLAQAAQGQEELVVAPLSVRSYRYLYVADVRENPEHWTNGLVAHFVGVKSVRRSCSYPAHRLPYDAYWFQIFSAEPCTQQEQP